MKTLSTLICIFLIVANSFSQKRFELEVVGMAEEEKSELVANEIKDSNGDVCAGLIIISDLNGLKYQSYNGIVKVNSMPGKDFLFLSPDENTVEVFSSGYVPLKIFLREAGVRLKSGQTWSIKIREKEYYGYLSIRLDENARIRIDGVEKQFKKNEPMKLLEKRYNVVVDKPGYNTYEATIAIERDSTMIFSPQLTRQKGRLIINTTPSNASLTIDNVPYPTKSPVSTELEVGIHTITIEHDGYQTVQRKIEIQANATSPFSFQLIGLKGRLIVNTTPSDASITIDNILYSTNSPMSTELDVGNHTIIVELYGYQTVKKGIDIRAGESSNLDIPLDRITLNREDEEINNVLKKSIEVSGLFSIEKYSSGGLGYTLNYTATGWGGELSVRKPYYRVEARYASYSYKVDVNMPSSIYGSFSTSMSMSFNEYYVLLALSPFRYNGKFGAAIGPFYAVSDQYENFGAVGEVYFYGIRAAYEKYFRSGQSLEAFVVDVRLPLSDSFFFKVGYRTMKSDIRINQYGGQIGVQF